MQQNDYHRLVRKLEVEATLRPALFRARVLLVSLSAYLVLGATLLGLALLLWQGWATPHHGLATVRLVLFSFLLLPLLLLTVRLGLMRIAAPEGRALLPADAPALFNTLAKLRARLNGPAIDHVLIDHQFNAGICQLRRYGLFGAHRNYLVLGLPFLLATPPREMLSAVAHEYGHLCGNDGQLGAAIYRQRRLFGALHQQVRDSDGNLLHDALRHTLNWFMPYYNAYTFVLSRQQEYEADRTAVTVFGATASAAALVRSTLLGRWFEQHFWPTLYRQAAHRPQPAFMPYGAMRAAFDASHGQWARPELLAAAWSEQSGLDDTHPALRDRLAACGQTAQLPPPATTCAADVLLGPATTRRLIAEFDHAWWSAERKDWRARCREASQGRARLAELAELATLTGPAALALPDMFEYALLSAELQSVAVAAPLLLHLLARPGGPFPRADYVYGAMLLEAGDARGLLHLEAAAGADHGLTDAAGRLGYSFVLRHDGGAAAEAWWEQLVTTA